MTDFIPAYVELLQRGELQERVVEAYSRLRDCNICAHECGVDRTEGVFGICGTSDQVLVSSYGPHLGEEYPLRGWRGSGTIFFSRCNLRCQFCQNYEISQANSGQETEPGNLAIMMLELQERGCHNINFVSPSHVVPQIMAGVMIAAQAGLRLPLVYNTGGYDSLQTLELLVGVIDIYMPDMKYASPQTALHYSKIPRYPQVNQAAVKEMHCQVGDLHINQRGIATRGLLVRHLVLPNRLAGTDAILRFLAHEISKDTYLNLMDQYRPAYKANQHPKLRRAIKRSEFEETVQMAREHGLHRLNHSRSRSI